MEIWKESQLKQLTFAKEVDAAYVILLRFAKNIGFNFCAVSITSTDRRSPFNTLKISNYPDDWKKFYEQKNNSDDDPVVAHCLQSMMPIVWSAKVFEKTPLLWGAMKQNGLEHGWSQSFHHAETGLCSTLSLARKHCTISPLEMYEHFGYMLYATAHLSELFARTLPQKSIHTHPPSQPCLSKRELEVLQYSAEGKTAYEISRILSLSERTVNYHVRNIIVKLNVCNKISAVRAAARFGMI